MTRTTSRESTGTRSQYTESTADAPDNLVLVYLSRLDEKVDRLVEDMREVKERLAVLKHQFASLEVQYASLSRRIDLSTSVWNESNDGWTCCRRLSR